MLNVYSRELIEITKNNAIGEFVFHTLIKSSNILTIQDIIRFYFDTCFAQDCAFSTSVKIHYIQTAI